MVKSLDRFGRNPKEDISDKIGRARATGDLIEKVPKAIKSFMEAFKDIDRRQQKVQLQTILKSAHIYKDGRIELEFRGESN